jgi:hypothetical protein
MTITGVSTPNTVARGEGLLASRNGHRYLKWLGIRDRRAIRSENLWPYRAKSTRDAQCVSICGIRAGTAGGMSKFATSHR